MKLNLRQGETHTERLRYPPDGVFEIETVEYGLDLPPLRDPLAAPRGLIGRVNGVAAVADAIGAEFPPETLLLSRLAYGANSGVATFRHYGQGWNRVFVPWPAPGHWIAIDCYRPDTELSLTLFGTVRRGFELLTD